jgi:hypothetical protein
MNVMIGKLRLSLVLVYAFATCKVVLATVALTAVHGAVVDMHTAHSHALGPAAAG